MFKHIDKHQLDLILNSCLNSTSTWCVAGGYVRDMVAGLTPKDCDVLVVDKTITNHTEAFALACEISDYISRNGLGSSEIFQAYGCSSNEDDFSKRHWACIKIELSNSIPIDILIETSSTLSEAVSHFDCNLNQWIIINDGWETPMYMGEESHKELHFLKPVRQVRIDKMTKFYTEHIVTNK
ncbi:MAG: hypothetical protein [Caudoviricetes sp.]|nr:MAG: hypothetical protein [Caudoviricetes sp.]